MSPEPSTRIVRLAANASVVTAGNALASAISIVTFAAVTRYLGPSAFGDLTAAFSFLFIVTVLADLGFSAVVLREISAAPHTTRIVMSTSVPLRIAIGSAASAAAVAAGLALTLNDRTETAVTIGALSMVLMLANYSLLPVLQARLQMQWAALATLAGRVVTLVATLAALEADLGFAAVVWAVVLGAAVTFLTNLVVVSRIVRFRPVVDLASWARLVRGSIALGLAIALIQVYFRVDAVLLAALRTSSDVGLYGVAYKFLELAQIVAGAVSLSIFPSLALHAGGDREIASTLAQKTLELLIAMGLGVMVLMLAFPRELITFVAGAEYGEAAAAVRILAPAPLLMFVASVLWWLLISRRHDRLLAWLAIGLLALKVSLDLAFIPSYGYNAAAAVTTATEFVALLIVVALAARRVDFIPSLRYSRVLAAAAAGMLLIALMLPGPALFAAAVAGAVYAAILLAVPGTVRTTAAAIAKGTMAFARG